MFIRLAPFHVVHLTKRNTETTKRTGEFIMAFRRNIAILTGLAALSFFALTLSAQSGNGEEAAKAKCEATRTKDQQCIVINQRFATSHFFSAPFNFAPFGFQNPEPNTCLVPLLPNGDCPAGQTVPVKNVSATGANLATYAGEGNAGKFTGEGISQSVVTFPFKPCKLDDGTPGFELHLIGHIASTRFDTGDLLFEHGGERALVACTDFATGRFDEYGTVDIIGGFGKYAGAKGTETVEQHGQVMVFPNAANTSGTQAPYNADGAFGFSHGAFIATFTIPKK
jgi:hypothetical protein